MRARPPSSQQMADAVSRGDTPGVVEIVVNRDGVLYEGAAGKFDVAKNVPMPTNAIFQIASMTKPVTSVAIMMLLEAGQAEARRSGVEVPDGLRQPAGHHEVQREGRDLRDAAGEDGDDHPASAVAHVRHRLRVHATRSSTRSPRRRRRASGSCRCSTTRARSGTTRASTRVLGFIVEKVTGVAARGLVSGAHLQAARHGGHVVRRGGRQAVAGADAVTAASRGTLVEQPRTPIPSTPTPPFRGDGGLYSTVRGLRQVRADAAQRRHARAPRRS